jgi:hypothetical protein
MLDDGSRLAVTRREMNDSRRCFNGRSLYRVDFRLRNPLRDEE